MLHCIKERSIEWIIGYCDCNNNKHFVTVQFDRLTNTYQVEREHFALYWHFSSLASDNAVSTDQ